MRNGFENCSTQGVALVCHGQQMFAAECRSPFENGCGSLALVYAGGDRVVIAPNGALRPEMAKDGSGIWFLEPDARADLWNVYDPSNGITQQRDAFTVAMMRERGAVPLWPGGAQ
ncbi:MAG: hypothetical protein ABR567_02560 [Myxococcales bacterium]|nr:hypothetical protein [Myxococcales bacterium]